MILCVCFRNVGMVCGGIGWWVMGIMDWNWVWG